MDLTCLNVAAFPHQIAGHTNEMVRRYGDKYIIKPQNKPDLFAREVSFYEEVFFGTEVAAQPFVPQFFGLVEVSDENHNDVEGSDCSLDSEIKRPCIILEDFTLHYEHPSLIDIKMGRQTFEPTASQAKVARELRKYPYQADIGFRITGLKVWNAESSDYSSYDKWFGRSLLPEQVIYGLAFFYHNGVQFKVRAINESLRRLNEILEWMKTQIRYKFFCSSILIVYGNGSDYDETTTDSIINPEYTSTTSYSGCRVGMIDFAHVCVNSPEVIEVDEGYIHGLKSLIHNLTVIRNLSENPREETEFVSRMREMMTQFSRSSS
jgi:1D-myo-inositol-tetrakisphosphate 5-kinase/inositol-polyphosphate multikinase